MRPLATLALTLLLAVPLRARAASPEELGVIEAEMAAGEKAVRDSFGDPKKLSRARLQELERKVVANRAAVLAKHKLSDRAYSKESVKLGRDRLAEKEAARKAREAELAAEAAKPRKKPATGGGVTVIRGFDSSKPVVVDEADQAESGEVAVERGGSDDGEGVTLYESEPPPERAEGPDEGPSEAAPSSSDSE